MLFFAYMNSVIDTGSVNLSNHLSIMIVYKKIEPISQMD